MQLFTSRQLSSLSVISVFLVLTALAPALTSAQTSGEAVTPQKLEDIVVTADRSEQSRKQLPESVTVIEQEEIEQQSQFTQDLGEITANLVPGLGESSENLTNTGQNLRGRSFLVMIDGVPQNASLRQVSKHLRSIAPEAIKRIEVIRGSVATYGLGAAGGIIHYITKDGADVDGRKLQTSMAVNGQTESSESLGGRLYQGIRANNDRLNYSINLSAKQSGVHYDGDGDIVPADGLIQGGSLSENEEYNFQTKLNYDLDEFQALEVALNYYDRLQDASYRADRSTGNNDPNEKILAESGSPQGEDPGTENLNFSLSHTLDEFYNGTLTSTVYHQDYETQFSFYSGYPSGGGQSQLLSNHTGARINHNRSLESLGNLIYGLDFVEENTEQNLLDGRTRTGELTETTYAPYAQLEVPLGESFNLQAGVRYESAEVDVATFQDETETSPATVQGATLEYSEPLFNAGIVYYLNKQQEVFAGYSEGFNVADIGRSLRGIATFDVSGSSVDAAEIDPQAQVVQNYELGWRYGGEALTATASGFLSTSDLGTTFGGPPSFELQRQKEEVYGLELTADYDYSDRTRFGGTGTYQDGNLDSNDDGNVDKALPSTRITPPKVTAYVEHNLRDDISGRLQGKYLFDRDPNNDGGFPNGEVNGYELVDLSLQKDAGYGTWTFAVDNLLDEQYIVPVAQAWNLSGRMVAGQGRSLSLEYSTKF